MTVLLNHGPKSIVNSLDAENNTPLHYLCANDYGDTNDESNIMHKLIEKGAFIDAVNKKNQTPLLLACAYKKYNLAKMLFLNKANTKIATIENETAYSIAKGDPEFPGQLLQGIEPKRD